LWRARRQRPLSEKKTQLSFVAMAIWDEEQADDFLDSPPVVLRLQRFQLDHDG
jgi:hypothetical protein